MRKKTENLDIIVDKKTVRITTAVFVTVMTMLAAIAAMFFTTMSVLAADQEAHRIPRAPLVQPCRTPIISVWKKVTQM